MEGMGKYYIDLDTGAGNEWFDGSLEDAKERASEAATYARCGVAIEDENGNIVAERDFRPVPFDGDYSCYKIGKDADIVDFGVFGHLDAWYDEFIWND